MQIYLKIELQSIEKYLKIIQFRFHRFRPNFRFGLDFCQTKIVWSCPNRYLLTSGLDNLNSSKMVDISVFEVKTPSSVQAAYCMSNSKYNKKMKIFSKSAAYALITVINMTSANATASFQRMKTVQRTILLLIHPLVQSL